MSQSMGIEKRQRITPSPAIASTVTIPDDVLIAEVLARLPVKSIVRFKCVQKSWLAATMDPWFVHRHLKFSRALPQDVLIVPREDSLDGDDDVDLSNDINLYRLRNPLSKDFNVTKAELMLERMCPEVITHTVFPSHYDGLVAVATATDQVYVSNPATKEFVVLPLGSHDVREFKNPTATLGFDQLRNRYVVARYFYRSYKVLKDEATGEQSIEYDIGHELFTLGVGHTWEITEDPPHAIGPVQPVYVGGAFYWCADKLDLNIILRFSLSDEKFSLVQCPPNCNGYDFLTEIAGKLCYVHTATVDAFDIWQLVDNGLEWSLCCRIDVDFEEIGCNAFFPIISKEEEMLIVVDHEKLYRYDKLSEILDDVVDMQEDLEYEREDGSKLTYGEEGLARYHVVPYVESLVSIRDLNY